MEQSTNESGSLTIHGLEVTKKKALNLLPYLASIIFLPWGISLSFTKTNPKFFLNDIQEKNILEGLIKLEELVLLDEMIKKYPETHIQKLRIGIHKKMIQLVRMHNQDHIHIILHFSTNITCFAILSAYSILGNEVLITLNSWVQEFLYNLSDTIKAFFILLLTDLCIGFHLPHAWELMIGSFYKDFGFVQNEKIISDLGSTFLIIVDIILILDLSLFKSCISFTCSDLSFTE
ncbi:unnamed protein product [Victoria cruziana]